MRNCLKLFVLLTGLASTTSAARADTYSVFNLTATLQTGTASGTVTLDTTTGLFSSANITANGISFYGAPNLVDQESTYLRTHFGFNGTSDPTASFFGLDLPVSSLAGYMGGSLCSTTLPCGNTYSAIGNMTSVPTDYVVTGALTLAATPEPSSLMLMGTGLLAAIGVARRRLA